MYPSYTKSPKPENISKGGVIKIDANEENTIFMDTSSTFSLNP